MSHTTDLEAALWGAEEAVRQSSDDPPREVLDASHLVGCLRRLVHTCTAVELHAAFGAPGDWGYDTALGRALSDIYKQRGKW